MWNKQSVIDGGDTIVTQVTTSLLLAWEGVNIATIWNIKEKN